MNRLLIILLSALVSLQHIACIKEAKKKQGPLDGQIGAYPTNFFRETVPKFVTNRPVIGILTIGLDAPPLTQLHHIEDHAYIGSSYVKWLESAGARVVPIIEDISNEKLEKLLGKLNGVVLPGGDLDTGDGGYYNKLTYIMKYSKEQWKKKKPVKFPILGLGRGASRMIVHITGKDSTKNADALNLTLPTFWTADSSSSRMFGKAPGGLKQVMETHALAFYHTAQVIPAENFYNDTNINKTLKAIATCTERNGTRFVSIYEGIKLPWYGFQFQPNAPQYEFNPSLAVDHTINSIIASQYIANFFVSEARQNGNRFESRAAENDAIIAKNSPTFVGNITDTQFDQIYLFKMKKHHEKEIKTEDDEIQDDGLSL